MTADARLRIWGTPKLPSKPKTPPGQIKATRREPIRSFVMMVLVVIARRRRAQARAQATTVGHLQAGGHSTGDVARVAGLARTSSVAPASKGRHAGTEAYPHASLPSHAALPHPAARGWSRKARRHATRIGATPRRGTPAGGGASTHGHDRETHRHA